MHLNWNC